MALLHDTVPRQGPYLDVLMETDPDQLPLKVSRALRAIATRLTTTELKSISTEEKRALENALATLRKLQEGEQSDTGAA
jgi:hypothetical protein